MLRTRGSGGRGPLLLLAAAALASGSNFAFHAVGSRLLGPASYSSLAALLALVVVMAVPVGAVQTAMTQASAANPGGSAISVVEQVSRAGVVLVAVGVAFAVPIDRSLQLHDAWGVALMAPWAAIACVSAAGKGALLGRMAYVPVSIALVVSAVGRIFFGLLLVPWLGVEGAMLATLLGEGVAAIFVLVAMRREGLLRLRAPELRPRGTDAFVVLGAQFGVWLLAGVTTMVGRRVLPGTQAGDFAAASTITSAATFLPLAVATAFFPRFTRDASRAALQQALALAAFLGGIVALALIVAPTQFVHLLAGHSFGADTSVVTMLALASALVGVVGVAVFFLLARRRPAALLVWVGAASASVASLVVDDARMLAAVALATTAVATVLVVVAAYRAVGGPVGDRGGLRLPACDRFLSVVVPTYNGGRRLRPTVDALCRSLDVTGWTYEVIVAVDGSDDGSDEALDACGPNVVVDRSTVNEGKGAALQRGFARAHGEVVGFVDGDGDIDVEIVRRLARACQDDRVWAAIASKHAAGSDVRMSIARRGLSRGYRRLVRLLFGLDVSDTQCGAKVFTRAGLERALPWARERGFALDVELLGLGRRLGLGEVVELPVRLRREGNATTVSAGRVLRTLEETLRVWSRVQDTPMTVTLPDSGVTIGPRRHDDAEECV